MARLSKSAVAEFFVSGARPNQSQFEDLIDSYQDFNDFLQQIATALATKSGVVTVSGSSTSAHAALPINLGGTGGQTQASALKSIGAVTAEAGGGFGVITSANVWTNENTWISSATGSAENPAINLDRRAPGLGGQNLGVVRFKGRDSLLASTTYAKMGGAIVSTSAGGETGRLQFTTIVSGASADRFIIAGGMYSLAASGGDKGIGTINVEDYYKDGNLRQGISFNETIVSAIGSATPTIHDISGLAGAYRITAHIKLGSLSGTDEFTLILGDSEGYETAGYTGESWNHNGTNVGSNSTHFILSHTNTGSDVWDITINLTRIDSVTNTWVFDFMGHDAADETIYGNGTKILTSALTKIRFGADGSDTFDGGNLYVMAEIAS